MFNNHFIWFLIKSWLHKIWIKSLIKLGRDLRIKKYLLSKNSVKYSQLISRNKAEFNKVNIIKVILKSRKRRYILCSEFLAYRIWELNRMPIHPTAFPLLISCKNFPTFLPRCRDLLGNLMRQHGLEF